MIINYHGTELEVDYKYYKPYRGYRNSMGVPEEPDEPASIEIEGIFKDGADITELCDAAGILDEIDQLVWEKLCQESYEDYYEYEREDR